MISLTRRRLKSLWHPRPRLHASLRVRLLVVSWPVLCDDLSILRGCFRFWMWHSTSPRLHPSTKHPGMCPARPAPVEGAASTSARSSVTAPTSEEGAASALRQAKRLRTSVPRPSMAPHLQVEPASAARPDQGSPADRSMSLGDVEGEHPLQASSSIESDIECDSIGEPSIFHFGCSPEL